MRRKLDDIKLTGLFKDGIRAVASYLDVKDLASLHQTCKKMRKIIDEVPVNSRVKVKVYREHITQAELDQFYKERSPAQADEDIVQFVDERSPIQAKNIDINDKTYKEAFQLLNKRLPVQTNLMKMLEQERKYERNERGMTIGSSIGLFLIIIILLSSLIHKSGSSSINYTILVILLTISIFSLLTVINAAGKMRGPAGVAPLFFARRSRQLASDINQLNAQLEEIDQRFLLGYKQA